MSVSFFTRQLALPTVVVIPMLMLHGCGQSDHSDEEPPPVEFEAYAPEPIAPAAETVPEPELPESAIQASTWEPVTPGEEID